MYIAVLCFPSILLMDTLGLRVVVMLPCTLYSSMSRLLQHSYLTRTHTVYVNALPTFMQVMNVVYSPWRHEYNKVSSNQR